MEIKNVLKIFNKDLFFVALVTFIIFFVLDIAWTGIISNYFNINILFFITFVSGIVYSIYTPNEKN